MIKSFLLLIGSLSICGCSTVGEAEFGCSGLPAGVSCVSASQLYNVVDKQGYEPGRNSHDISSVEYRKDSLGRRESGRPDTGDDTRSGVQAQKFFGKVPRIDDGGPDQLFLLNPPPSDGTDPVRMAAAIRRVWLAPWVDQDQVYHGEQLLYVETKPEKWLNGEKLTTENPFFSPLNQ